MEVLKIHLWEIVNLKRHPLSKRAQKKVNPDIGIAVLLFPGINWYSIPGITLVRDKAIAPVLKVLLPELLNLPADKVGLSELVDLKEVLDCGTYDWRQYQWHCELAKRLGGLSRRT